VLRPLGTLESVADGISRGRFPGRIRIGSSHEMDRVGQALSSMSAKLEEGRNRLEEEVQNATSELALANEELKTLDRLKSEFLATMSHELRSPLTSIRGGLDYLRRTETAPDRQGYLHIMDKNVNRLTHLVTDIFDITRIEAEKIDWNFEPADMTELVGEIVEIMSPLAEECGLRLSLPPTGPMNALADVERIEQVIVNLTDNAIKYSPAGGVISFALRIEGEEIRIQVRDQGPGIPHGEREAIFKKFHTTPSSGAKGKPGGTGLGLSIAKGFIEAHKGMITVENRSDGGALFIISIPAETFRDNINQ